MVNYFPLPHFLTCKMESQWTPPGVCKGQMIHSWKPWADQLHCSTQQCYCLLPPWINSRVCPRGRHVQGYFSAWLITKKMWQPPSIQPEDPQKTTMPTHMGGPCWIPDRTVMAVAQDSRCLHGCVYGCGFNCWVLEAFVQTENRGTWVALSVRHPTLGFNSDHDLLVHGTEPHIRLLTDSTEPAWDSLPLSLSK